MLALTVLPLARLNAPPLRSWTIQGWSTSRLCAEENQRFASTDCPRSRRRLVLAEARLIPLPLVGAITGSVPLKHGQGITVRREGDSRHRLSVLEEPSPMSFSLAGGQ